LLKMHLVACPPIHLRICHQRLEFFLCAFWRCGSACATTGRGLRKRNPNCRNTLDARIRKLLTEAIDGRIEPDGRPSGGWDNQLVH